MEDAKERIKAMKNPVILMNPEDIKTLREASEGEQTHLGVRVIGDIFIEVGEILVVDMINETNIVTFEPLTLKYEPNNNKTY